MVLVDTRTRGSRPKAGTGHPLPLLKKEGSLELWHVATGPLVRFPPGSTEVDRCFGLGIILWVAGCAQLVHHYI